MKYTKKFFALLLTLVLSVGIFSGCAPINPQNTNTGEDTDYSSETSKQNDVDAKYKKQYCTATIEENFTEKHIIVTLMPSANEKIYTLEDFEEFEFTNIERYVSPIMGPNEPRTRLTLTLKTPSKENVLKAIKIIEQRPDVYSAMPDYYATAGLIPTDAYYRGGSQYELDIISMPSAWNITTGSSSVTVGIIDTGIDISHEELNTRINTSLSRSFSNQYTAFQDGAGHGTAVAGIIGAETNTSVGMAGICWNIQLVSLNVWDGEYDSYNVPIFSMNKLISAVEYAETAGIDILNISITTDGYNSEYRNVLSSFSGLIVCSAGNDTINIDSNPLYPTSFNLNNVISVGASTNNDTLCNFSNYGSTSVDLFAPGEGIVSCVNSPIKYRADFSGTSFSAPMVAGVAALILSVKPNASPSTVKSYILNNTDYCSALDGYCATDGRLNAYKALSAATHVHSYTYRYTSVSSTGHNAYCSCGAYISQTHTFTSSGSTLVCSKCGYSSISLNNQGLEVEMQ